jgi:redox-sensitive bicupin YhaK (pirin superfamily)
MSWQPCDDPIAGDKRSCDAIETVIVPRTRDLGGFEVRRALPSAKRRMVGPFIFWDQMGPSEFVIGEGIDVRPHPHIGIATITYLFDGKIFHRDSLGSEIAIEPGEVNWMTAGKGIVHSKRTEEEWRKQDGRRLFGIQSWIALPKSAEEMAPDFAHVDKGELPLPRDEGKQVRIIAGSMFGERSPIKTASDMFYVDVVLEPGAKIPLSADHEERGVYIAEGEIDIAGDSFESGSLVVFKPSDEITITAKSAARIQPLGGEPMDGPRYIWWNFVSSSQERIDQAKEDWRQKRFDSVPGDTEEFIPLPD